MVKLGTTENHKSHELKKSVPDSTDVVVLQPKAPPTPVRSTCYTKRVIVCVLVASVLVTMAIAGTMLGLYLSRGTCEEDYIDDIEIWQSVAGPWDLGILSSSAGDSASDSIFDGMIDGDHHGDHDGDGDHHGDHHDGGGHDGGFPGEDRPYPPSPRPQPIPRQ